MPVAPPAFLIVGTARSGTTLVQRLASELAGVSVPPETHFFSHFAPGLLRRAHFPLGPDGLARELERYLDIPSCRGIELSVPRVVDRLGGTCGSALEMFAATVAEMAGPCRLVGEKTPEHLLWWRPLSTAWPELRIVAVVRDPRAVVASGIEAPFGMNHAELVAERWLADQRTLAACRRSLAPERLLVLRYEDVVASPQGARDDIARFIGAELAPAESHTPLDRPRGRRLYQGWETWKTRVDDPVTTDRVSHWQSVLTPRQVRQVEAICHPLMEAHGYRGGRGGFSALRTSALLGPAAQARRTRYRQARRRLEAEAERVRP